MYYKNSEGFFIKTLQFANENFYFKDTKAQNTDAYNMSISEGFQ